jgi:hypothetical protein
LKSAMFTSKRNANPRVLKQYNSIAMHVLHCASVRQESQSKDILQAPSRDANVGQVTVLLSVLRSSALKKPSRSSAK